MITKLLPSDNSREVPNMIQLATFDLNYPNTANDNIVNASIHDNYC